MKTHNPKDVIEQLQVVLSNPSKKIGFLFGAGISAVDKKGHSLIKTSQEMTKTVVAEFDGKMESAVNQIEDEIKSNSETFNVETLLSKISEKEKAVGKEALCGLNKEELTKLRKSIENKIKDIVSVHSHTDFPGKELSHDDFAKWVKHADRKFPVEIFTTNYDYLLESGMEKQKAPYFDGFIGSNKAFFYPEWIEDSLPVKDWTKLWKLHGSLGWDLENDEIIRVSNAKESAMIYPSFLKYDHSRKQPYLSYMDRLSWFLKQEDSVLFVCGYSFGDDHINGMILTALTNSRSSHVFVLKRSKMEESDDLSKYAKDSPKISVYAKRTAVIGGKFGSWKLENEPNRNESYNLLDYGFDEDAVLKDAEWSGEGDFVLGDFKRFSDFLALFYTNSRFVKG
ncbi:SIR2-like domain-containing protein [Desulfuromusa kysingii]|uniref:SIR2-like domain-containing protein n=1 Tax=Desulfuromusa kysingii TaxID=37625 RepID=A0A1H3YZS7_9BACT|nr:SIR2 family protein [Desulfuromusa kysingii]SEA17015.1 SIR2-like domain-containing protein [Desulfuromusa kysingii]